MSTTMLYKSPGQHEIHGHMLDYIIVDDDSIQSAIANGWHLTTDDAVNAGKPRKKPKLGSGGENAAN